MNSLTLLLIFAVILLPGFIGVILPGIPGIPYMLLVALGFGVVDKFVHLRSYELVALACITAASLAADYFSGLLGAKFGGASNRSILYGTIGLVVGSLLFPPFGGIVAMAIIIFLIESRRQGQPQPAIKAAGGSVLGFISGTVINILLAILFFILFLVFALN